MGETLVLRAKGCRECSNTFSSAVTGLRYHLDISQPHNHLDLPEHQARLLAKRPVHEGHAHVRSVSHTGLTGVMEVWLTDQRGGEFDVASLCVVANVYPHPPDSEVGWGPGWAIVYCVDPECCTAYRHLPNHPERHLCPCGSHSPHVKRLRCERMRISYRRPLVDAIRHQPLTARERAVLRSDWLDAVQSLEEVR